jgi:hypothetical protein
MGLTLRCGQTVVLDTDERAGAVGLERDLDAARTRREIGFPAKPQVNTSRRAETSTISPVTTSIVPFGRANSRRTFPCGRGSGGAGSVDRTAGGRAP